MVLKDDQSNNEISHDTYNHRSEQNASAHRSSPVQAASQSFKEEMSAFESSRLLVHTINDPTRRECGIMMAVCTVIVLLVFLPGAMGGFMEERHRRDRGCSLGSEMTEELSPSGYCSLVPQKGVDSMGRVLISFGESNCQFVARQCMVGFCYLIHDFSSMFDRDINITAVNKGEDLPTPAGIFRDVSVQGGEVRVSDVGIQIVPTQGEVAVTYSTKTCAEFYRDFGREKPQVCNGLQGLAGRLTMVHHFDASNELPCNNGLPAPN